MVGLLCGWCVRWLECYVAGVLRGFGLTISKLLDQIWVLVHFHEYKYIGDD